MANDFNEIAAEIVALHNKKNSDYGNAFGKSFDLYESYRKGAGLEYSVGRIGDKMQRLQNLVFTAAVPCNESIEDTLLDMAAYAIMAVESLRAK